MEVRIKEGNGYVDAEWTIEDGVMVVSPKEVKFEFKDGDVLASDKSYAIYIFKENISEDCNIGYVGINNANELRLSEYEWGNLIFRPATEEEKKLLFDKLAEKGLAWDAEKMELVKLKWKPKNNEIYCRPRFNEEGFACCKDRWDNVKFENFLYNKGWVFKTEKECQEFCNRLNEAINSVKP